MKMQDVRCSATGNITGMLNLESVDLVTLSECGTEIWVVLKSGHKFRVFEQTSFNTTTIEDVMNGFATAFKKLSKPKGD